MSDEVEIIAKRLKEREDIPISISTLADELGVPETRMVRDVRTLLAREGFFDLGNGRIMFTDNSHKAAYEIFRDAAPHISFDEYMQHKDRLHILIRLSRDRDIAYRADVQRMVREPANGDKKRGNSVF